MSRMFRHGSDKKETMVVVFGVTGKATLARTNLGDNFDWLITYRASPPRSPLGEVETIFKPA